MMNKKRSPQPALNLSEDDLKILEKRVGSAIREKAISDLEKQFVRKSKVEHGNFPGILKIAAFWICVVSLPLMVLFFVVNGDKGIFNRYYSVYNYQDITGINRGLASALYTPYYLYSEEDYSGALPRFRQFLEVNPSDIQARLLLAVCLIEAKEFAEAESELKKIVQSGNVYFLDDAHWYLSLLAVRDGNFIQAGELLRQLGSNNKYETVVQSLEKKIVGKLSR